MLNSAAIPYYDSQPDDGPQTGLTPPQRVYSDGVDTAWHQTVNAGIAKSVQFDPPPTATLGSLVTYTLIVPASPISATLYDVVVTDTLDSRFYIEGRDHRRRHRRGLGLGRADRDATFASIPHSTQAFITVTRASRTPGPTRITTPNAGPDHHQHRRDDAQHGDGDHDDQRGQHDGGRAGRGVVKSVESSTAITTDLDGEALLTYTLRLENTGNSPAYSLYITDAVPAASASRRSTAATTAAHPSSAPARSPGR